MTSRNWVYLFFTTLIIGAVSTIFVGFAVEWSKYSVFFTTFNIVEILSIAIWFIGVGFIFSLISQAGYFAYLTVHRFGMGMFKSLWGPVQIVLTVFVLFDFIYLRYTTFATEGDALLPYVIPAVLILVYGLIVAYYKVKQTNQTAFIPALFFISAITIIEWVPALRANERDWLLLMIFPLLICNTWQLFILHKLNQKSKK
ncbi:KinB-signaling pathway activation in sporulation [Schinkia azotoformans MEV2011]|uniref:KinB-signaling pathway activation in sporulation n=1 Tax=Schinkia azotoformans MEV2011 TaxID=1348973 RepID=A0A072NTG4_SCHAZ|nr:KinB-signaling pathway activation protein [Schinkia azotoformans]KEF36520.1 KinB-signaling pathway activation in sporulation [Schinkia azotoformans MEV2011]MEC1695771.1 KinB-signaling pathway activation protein [Schinkia azotoformans]MEC1717524.1 KinB-signaling pathway activation protein [Schinkia azotoformans]MEC1723943.1 KinB-signaling pathway activation protein [Schinkia azotoformans]MEC1740681.1 KinB-signaling pathway activation protein [Schinkia azotoformans]